MPKCVEREPRREEPAPYRKRTKIAPATPIAKPACATCGATAPLLLEDDEDEEEAVEVEKVPPVVVDAPEEALAVLVRVEVERLLEGDEIAVTRRADEETETRVLLSPWGIPGWPGTKVAACV